MIKLKNNKEVHVAIRLLSGALMHGFVMIQARPDREPMGSSSLQQAHGGSIGFRV